MQFGVPRSSRARAIVQVAKLYATYLVIATASAEVVASPVVRALRIRSESGRTHVSRVRVVQFA